jgi:hypothetical protein
MDIADVRNLPDDNLKRDILVDLKPVNKIIYRLPNSTREKDMKKKTR